jgi:hypothetical protein
LQPMSFDGQGMRQKVEGFNQEPLRKVCKQKCFEIVTSNEENLDEMEHYGTTTTSLSEPSPSAFAISDRSTEAFAKFRSSNPLYFITASSLVEYLEGSG